MKKLVTFIVLALLLTFWATPVYAAVPALPHAFYGDVEINGSPAPDGTQISATVDVGTVVPVQNPVSTVGGSFGIDSPKLLVQGDGLSGNITFYVTNENGTAIVGETYPFEIGGGPTPLVLEVTIAEPEPTPSPTPSAPTVPHGTTDVRGMVTTAGVFLEPITATSEDELLTLTIPEGTVGLTEELEPLDEITVVIMDEPPAPPEDAHVIGLTYDLGPDGATFDPPITLTFSYDPDALPEGVAEADLVLAYYDEDTGEWIELDGVVDTVNNTITASVPHFTTFAIIGSVTEEEEVPTVVTVVEEEEEPEVVIPVKPEPAAFSVSYLSVRPRLEVQPDEMVTITVFVTNTGGESGSYTAVLKIDGVKEAEQTITVAAGESQDVSFSVAREQADSYSVTVDGLSGSFSVVAPPEEEEEEEELPIEPSWLNWPLFVGIIAAVLIIGGLVIYFFSFRRRAY